MQATSWVTNGFWCLTFLTAWRTSSWISCTSRIVWSFNTISHQELGENMFWSCKNASGKVECVAFDEQRKMKTIIYMSLGQPVNTTQGGCIFFKYWTFPSRYCPGNSLLNNPFCCRACCHNIWGKLSQWNSPLNIY